jgi:ABC-type Fe3+/spermidine/putrescine transport system ATPase subunit
MTLALRSLSKAFDLPDGRSHAAVCDVTLAIEPGTFCTLLGPSGCGKTTLLRLVAGFEQPTRGEILHDGRSLDGVPPYARNFPMVFQSYALFPHLTVAENVAYGLRLRKLPRADVEARVARALDLLGIESQRDKHPARLSGGQQQRVALARALVLEPPLILLDEPLSNLDAGLRVSMRAEIRALQRRLGITALYVTHDQEEALAVSDRVVVMNDGRVEQDGPPAEIWHRPATRFVANFMGAENVLPVERDADGGLVILGERYDAPASMPGDALFVVIRSDAIERMPGGRHRGVVEEAAFLGARVRLRVGLESGEHVTLDDHAGSEAPQPQPHDVLSFSLRPERLHFLAR